MLRGLQSWLLKSDTNCLIFTVAGIVTMFLVSDLDEKSFMYIKQIYQSVFKGVSH